MKFITHFIHKPILAAVLSILIIVFGILDGINLPVRFLPKISQAYVNVTTIYPGANGETVKSFVTSKIQSAIVGINGIDYITSSSTSSVSSINIYLNPGTDPDRVLSAVIGEVSGIQNQLPPNTLTPSITRKNIDSYATMIIAFTSNRYSRPEIAEYLRRYIQPNLEVMQGVSDAQVWADDYAMQIWLDPVKMANFGIGANQIYTALNQYNVLSTPGIARGINHNYQLSLNSDLHTANDFNDIPVKLTESRVVTLKDIGYAKTGALSDDYMVYFNNEPAVMIGVIGLDTANPLSISKDIRNVLSKVGPSLPKGIEIHVVLDRADAIYSSLREVIKTLGEAILIVVIVVYLFLGSIRAALIPAIAIPLSLLGVVFFMYLLGYSINTITLLAMVISIGLVVDDAIVVVENIMRHLKEKVVILDATITATTELLLPIIAMTITLATVYSPIEFVGGVTGQLFVEFAFTLACSVILSGIVSIFVTPVVCTKILTSGIHSKLHFIVEKIFLKVQNVYIHLLTKILSYKRILQILWGFILLLCIVFYFAIPKEFIPKENLGFLMVTGDAPSNTNTHYLSKAAKAADKIFGKFPQVAKYSTVVSPEEGFTSFIISKVDSHGNIAPLNEQISKIQEEMNNIPEINLRVISPGGVASSGPSIQIVLKSTDSYKELYAIAKQVEKQATSSGKFLYIYDNLNYSELAADIVVDRNELNAYQIPMSSLSNTLANLMSNNEVQYFSMYDKSYWVVLRTVPEYQSTTNILKSLPIHTINNQSIPLDAIATVKYHVEPKSLNQFQKLNSVTISAEPNKNLTISQGLDILNGIIKQINLPINMSIDYSGGLRQYVQEGSKMVVIFTAAILIIFLVLSIQFMSFRDSLIILLGSVPMALFSSLLALEMFGISLNVYTQIGLLTLIGLISKHGILIIRHANEICRQQNIMPANAVIKACKIRLRPILMTSVAIILAVLPLIFANGVGQVSRHDLGIVIEFGISIGTLFTLFLFPVVYITLSKRS